MTATSPFNRQESLWDAHEAGAERADAIVTNFGWSETDNAIASKTTLRALESATDSDGHATHTWLSRRPPALGKPLFTSGPKPAAATKSA